MNPTPTILLRGALLLALFCLATSIAGVVVAVRGQAWYVLAFEIVVLITAAPTAWVLAGRARAGHAMAMLCLGGVVGVTAALIDPELVKAIIQRQKPNVQPIGGVNVMPWILARLAAGGVLCAMSALAVLLRRPGRSFPLLFKGIALGLPVVACLAAAAVPSMRARFTGLSPIWLIVLAIAGTAVICVLISASGHMLIRAFQAGIEDEAEPAKR